MAAYDVAIRGGRPIDPETGLDAARNVGIQGDFIHVGARHANSGVCGEQ